MKHTIELTTAEIQEAVREYLEARGYICGCGSSNMDDVARVYFGTENGVTCSVEGARPAGSRHAAENDEQELNR